MARQEWSQTWMGVAQVVARRSLCVRARVGAVVVDSDNRIRSTGYNGPPRDWLHDDGSERGLGRLRPVGPCTDWCPRAQRYRRSVIDPESAVVSDSHDDCPSLHAEANALMFGDRDQRVGGAIYVTRMSCFTCAKLIANSGVASYYCLTSDADRHLDPDRTMEFLRSSGVSGFILGLGEAA